MHTTGNFPEGSRITFTGRLASMSRASAIKAVCDRGGAVRDLVTQRTNLLVIGADGWPLRKSGSITRNLQRASKLQDSGYGVSIISEAEFLGRMCDSNQIPSVHREHTVEQLSRLLGISGLRLRRWISFGLIQSNDNSSVTPMFDFQQVAAAKALSRLVDRGIPPSKLANSLRRLQRWLPDDGRLGVSIVALENQLLLRDGDELIDSHGQFYFAFDKRLDNSPLNTSPDVFKSIGPDALFDRAYQKECAGNLSDAIADYTSWLESFGDDHEVLFNLANVHLQKGIVERAVHFYYRCVEVEPAYARAWNNLGLCLQQLGDDTEAIAALRQAVDIDPDDVEMMFNLADLLDETGRLSEARLFWLRIARNRGQCADELKQYAEKRVSETPSHAIGQ